MRAESKISSLYISIFIGMVVFLGLIIFQSDIFGRYGVTSPDLGYLNMTNEIFNQSSVAKSLTEPTPITGIAPLDSLIASLFNSLNVLFGIGNLYTTFIGNIGEILSIPAILIHMLIGVVLIIITLSIISIIANRDV